MEKMKDMKKPPVNIPEKENTPKNIDPNLPKGFEKMGEHREKFAFKDRGFQGGGGRGPGRGGPPGRFGQPQKAKNRGEALRRLIKYFGNEKKLVFLLVAVVILITIGSLKIGRAH
ncbi:MAG: hypothetical protein J6M16_11300, partial [Clostridia bacterium]|nr:hypothetical protein [Clostridia bacterium]